jgi:hypothetical protein
MSMADPPNARVWPQLRRALIILAVLAGGIAVLSLLSGRPGDFQAGLPGIVVGGLVAAIIVSVELIGRSLARRQPDPNRGKDSSPGPEANERKG